MSYIRGALYLVTRFGRTSEGVYIGANCFRLATSLSNNARADQYPAMDTVNKEAEGLDVTAYPYWAYTWMAINVEPLSPATGNRALCVPDMPEPEEAGCECRSLLAGHEEGCAYARGTSTERARLENVWGIPQPKPAPDVRTLTDKYGPKGGAVAKAFTLSHRR